MLTREGSDSEEKMGTRGAILRVDVFLMIAICLGLDSRGCEAEVNGGRDLGSFAEFRFLTAPVDSYGVQSCIAILHFYECCYDPLLFKPRKWLPDLATNCLGR